MLLALALAACTPTAAPPAPPTLPDTWLVQVRRENWTPRDLDYVLRLEQTGSGWTGRTTLDPLLVGRTTLAAHDIVVADGQMSLSIGGEAEGFPRTTLSGPLQAGLWTGTHAWQGPRRPQAGRFVAHPRTVIRFEGTGDDRLPDAPDPATTGLDPLLLDRLVLGAEEARSDQLVVVSDGQVVARRHFGGTDAPMSIQSITKPIAALALGMLQAEGRLGSLDEPASRWLPGLTGHGREAITLRHLLTHTSGLDPEGTPALNRAKDRLAFSLETPVVHAPGTQAAYNNRAFNLLSGVIQAAAGEEPAAYLGPRLFAPLGMDSVTWGTDKAGHNPVYVGLSMTATDLAMLGHVLASDGRWQGEQRVPTAWLAEMQQPSIDAAPRRGLSWALRPDSGHALGPDPQAAPLVAFGHTGSQGQQIWVHPDVDLVVVRLIDLTDTSWGIQEHRDAMNELAYMVDALAQDKRHRAAP